MDLGCILAIRTHTGPSTHLLCNNWDHWTVQRTTCKSHLSTPLNCTTPLLLSLTATCLKVHHLWPCSTPPTCEDGDKLFTPLYPQYALSGTGAQCFSDRDVGHKNFQHYKINTFWIKHEIEFIQISRPRTFCCNLVLWKSVIHLLGIQDSFPLNQKTHFLILPDNEGMACSTTCYT